MTDLDHVLKTIRAVLSHLPNRSSAIAWFHANDGAIAAGEKTIGDECEGRPVTRALQRIASDDGHIASGVWDSTAGTHRFQFDFDEILHFVEGEAHVTANGETYTFRAGDVAFVRAGVEMKWNVPNYVRKVWVHRYPPQGRVRRGLRAVRRVVGF